MQILFQVIEMAVNIFEMYILYVMVSMFCDVKKKNINTILVIVSQAFLIYVLAKIFGNGSYLGVLTSLAYVVVSYVVVEKLKISRVCMSLLIFLMFVTTLDFVGMMIIKSVYKIEFSQILEFNNHYRLMVMCISKLLLYFTINIFKDLKYNYKNIKKIYILEFIVIMSVNIVLVLWILDVYKKGNTYDQNKIMLITIVYVIFTSFIIKLVTQIINYSKKEFEWKQREQQYSMQKNHMEEMQKLIYGLRAQRHDFNHHIGCIYGFLELENHTRAYSYAKKIVDDSTKVNEYMNIENITIGALINFKLQGIEERKIDLNLKVDIPKNLDIEDTDLSIILGNGIDNAIEACMKCNQEDRYIKINMYQKKKHMIIKIENSKSEESDFDKSKFKTSKKDKKNHGFGLENINTVVEKYDGIMKIDNEKERFLLNIALKN